MFRSRGKGPSLKQVSGNVFSDKLPGGNLILAVLDRDLMTWSDRGGASRHFGDCWSEMVTDHLNEQIGSTRSLRSGETYQLESVVRLDDDTRIAIQAGRHKLTNPDFVLFGRKPDGGTVLQAADSKFAVDTIKPAQVSAEALQALLDVENGLARIALEQAVHSHDVISASVERGVFLSPHGPLTEFFLPRLLTDPRIEVDRSHIELIDVKPMKLFGGLEIAPLIGELARIDHLPVTPRDHLTSAMYYLRVACACAWMWVEERTPLLSRDDPPEVDYTDLSGEIERRSRRAESAFDVPVTWSVSVEEVTRNRKALNDMMSVPVRMSEIRKMVEKAGLGENRKAVKTVRAGLDRRYRQRMLDEVGEIPSTLSQPLPDVLQQVATVSRSLRPELMKLTGELVEEIASQSELRPVPASGTGE